MARLARVGSAVLNTFAALPIFCGAYPLGAPRQTASCNSFLDTNHSAFGTGLAMSVNRHLPVPPRPEPDG